MQFKAEKVKINIDNPKKWYVSYTIKYANGVTKYPKVYGGEYGIRLNDSQDDERIRKAQELLKEVNRDLALGNDPKERLNRLEKEMLAELKGSKAIPYDEAIKIMIEYYNWDNPNESSKITAHNSKIFFNAAFKKFVTSIDKLHDVTSITKVDIERLLMQKNKDGKWNINTCKNKVGTISQLFIPLVDKELMEFNPCKGVSGIKRKLKRNTQKPANKRFQVWTDDELVEFESIANCDQHRFYYALGMTCYYAFIRRSECFRMKLGMVDFDNLRFIMDSDLTKSARKFDLSTNIYLPMAQELHGILKKYVDQRFGADQNPDYFLFPSIKDNNKQYPYFQFDVDYKKKLGVKLSNDKAKYDLKHTGVTHYWRDRTREGMNANDILTRLQMMCRHSSVFQTMQYLTTDLGIDLYPGTKEREVK